APRSAPASRKLTGLVERRTLAPMVRVVKQSKAAKPNRLYDTVLDEIVDLIEVGRRRAARMVNATMTAVYWSIGRRIVVEEQRGARRAEYGEELIKQLAQRLTGRFGRGFGRANLWQMRAFYLAYAKILQTTSGESASESADQILQTACGELDLAS